MVLYRYKNAPWGAFFMQICYYLISYIFYDLGYLC